jgi:hypothetical protein
VQGHRQDVPCQRPPAPPWPGACRHAPCGACHALPSAPAQPTLVASQPVTTQVTTPKLRQGEYRDEAGARRKHTTLRTHSHKVRLRESGSWYDLGAVVRPRTMDTYTHLIPCHHSHGQRGLLGVSRGNVVLVPTRCGTGGCRHLGHLCTSQGRCHSGGAGLVACTLVVEKSPERPPGLYQVIMSATECLCHSTCHSRVWPGAWV